MDTYLPYPGSVLPFTPTADHALLRGYFVKNSSGSAALIAAATDVPLGVIVDGQPTSGKDSVAVSGSGVIAMVKCAATAGTINIGTYLQLDGTTLGAVSADDGSGARVLVAVALEAGANNALIPAVLIKPISIGNAVTLGNVNGAIAALTSSATTTQAEFNALRDATETLADDVRAIYLALQTAGILA